MSDLNTILANLGRTRKKDIEKELSKETGLSSKDITKALPGVHSAFKGAEVADKKGIDPTKMEFGQLKSLDPSAPKKDAADTANRTAGGTGIIGANKMSNEETLTMALLGTLPSLIGYALGGYRGGEAGAKATEKGAGVYIKGMQDRRLLEQKQVQREQDVSLKNRGLDIQSKTAEGLIAQRANTQNYRNSMLDLKGRQVAVQENKALNTPNGVKPTKLSNDQFKQLQSLQTSKKMLDSLKKDIVDHPNLFGMKNYAINRLNPTKINDPEINAMKLKLKKVAITTGASVKGLPLTQEEAHSWENDLSNVDSAEGLLKKLELFEEMRREKESSFLNTAKINNQPVPGYEGSEDKGYPIEKEGEVKAKPDFKNMTPEQLKKYIQGND